MNEITVVTRENGSRRDPYPPTTVSLLTNPRVDFKSARTTRISHLRWLVTTDRSEMREQSGPSGRSARRPRRKYMSAEASIEKALEHAERQQRQDRTAVAVDARR